jgi:hypothetical protein
MTTDEIISRCYEHGQPDYVLAADRLKILQVECDSLREANDTWVALFGPSPALPNSPPVYLAPHNSGERDPSVTLDYAGGEALTDAELGRWCYENPNLAAMTIRGLRRKDNDLSDRLLARASAISQASRQTHD